MPAAEWGDASVMASDAGSGRPRGAQDAVASSSIALRAGFALSRLEIGELWVAYAILGGSLDVEELEAVLDGRRRATNHEHDTIAQALNDHFTERGQDHPVAYSEDLDAADQADPPEG